MLITDQHPLNRSLMIGLLGKPNVGKSSLANAFLGFDLSVVTHKAQTTRNSIRCVVHIDRTELVFVDTPGIHSSAKEINKRMNQQAKEGNRGVDLHLLLVDLTQPLGQQIEGIKNQIEEELSEIWLVFTKVDKLKGLDPQELKPFVTKAQEVLPQITKHFAISNTEETGISELTGALLDKAPNAPHFYPEGEVSNKNERFFATEYIREQTFRTLKEELPYETAVVIDEFVDNKNPGEKTPRSSKISASILVNRPSQRAIVVGKQGSVIKEIGVKARERIEQMCGRHVCLNLHVKVAPKWFSNNRLLEEMGLPRAENSGRVWRQS